MKTKAARQRTRQRQEEDDDEASRGGGVPLLWSMLREWSDAERVVGEGVGEVG